ncbi:MAG TPA: tetratricopeptide repeat protein [Bacteroidales bacterium]|nr:tetratricopeptide repeat protein [Bacteroidales bacterium]HPS16185.1 tetratricopeptide repeat protein [Bacteroidales bacterium]
MKKIFQNKILLISLLIFFIQSFSFAQPETDEQLAAQYFQNKEYDKALVYYEKLYNKKQDYLYYSSYLSCLVELKDYKTAEKIIKKQIKRNISVPQYGVDLGYLYNVQGDEKKAAEQYDLMIKNAIKDKQYVIDLANAFLLRKKISYAVETYEKMRKAMSGYYPFSLELAEIYGSQGEYEKMMEEYIKLIQFNSSEYLEKVQEIIQDILTEDTDGKQGAALKKILLKKIQENPDETFYSEMLLWYSTQIKDFDIALIQAKSLDKRNKEDGKRVFNIARLASSNGFYDIAIAAYQYIINKGSENYYYLSSKTEILDTKFLKITTSLYTNSDIESLVNDYKSALDELGKSSYSISIIKNYAHLLAFYSYKTEEAIKLLYEALEIKSAQAKSIAECKIELADILLMTGEVWEATLLYSQVEKAFKDEPIGHLAKFKNAKLSYYIGEFEWAKTQLDVLKAATSKLIANDAMDLSLLISDNSDMDSTYDALMMYSRADLLFFRNKNNEAIKTLDSLFIKYKFHSLFDEAYYKKAEIYMKEKLYDSAVVYYKKVEESYAFDILADDALYKLAGIYEIQYKDTVKAMEYYEKLMTNYPGSTYVIEARKKYRTLRGDVVN